MNYNYNKNYYNPKNNPYTYTETPIQKNANQILQQNLKEYYRNKNPFGGKGAVIIEEIEVDEDGNMLGKNYKMMQDKRPKNLLANPKDPWASERVFDAEDAYYLALRERKLKKKHAEMKKIMKRLKKEQEYLREKEEYLNMVE